ncbi:hypothetical protein ACN26Y_29800 [Micromonospora sp. WMMD558]|uniref:hypothetical protein n=1 Tax=Micromonospora sp. WMMD558 TaxID=3403462 RepID=UPI003BF5E01F
MSALTTQARETIKNYGWTERVTIAGYTRHYFGEQPWGGDACGCVDDRCIGFHHNDEGDCQCLPVWLDDYVKALRAGGAK